jgi:hypothetical protein
VCVCVCVCVCVGVFVCARMRMCVCSYVQLHVGINICLLNAQPPHLSTGDTLHRLYEVNAEIREPGLINVLEGG